MEGVTLRPHFDGNGTDFAVEHLRQWLHYDPKTGEFFWKECLSNAAPVGSRAGSPDKRGYWYIQINGHLYRANRLAWFYIHGVWPEGHIDHKNRNTSDDRIENLRDATRSQNQANAKRRGDNKSGFKGVSLHKLTGKWSATIQVRGKRKHLGLFPTPESAFSVYIEAARSEHGEFARAA